MKNSWNPLRRRCGLSIVFATLMVYILHEELMGIGLSMIMKEE